MSDQQHPSDIPAEKRRFFPWWLIVGGILLILLVGFQIVETMRGKSAWEEYKQKLEAAGEKLSWRDYLPVPVADSENFISTPFMQAVGYKKSMKREVWAPFTNISVGDWTKAYDAGAFIDLAGCRDTLRTRHRSILPSEEPQNPAEDILAFIEVAREPMDELRTAAQRPHSQFLIQGSPFEAPLPNFVVARHLAHAFSMHASASLAVGDSDTAWQDVRVLHQLAGAFHNSAPLLVSTMIGTAIYGLELQVIWEGLARRQWTDDQLKKIQADLESVDLIETLDRSWRGGERNGIIAVVEKTRKSGRLGDLFQMASATGAPRSVKSTLLDLAIPEGWIDMNLYHYVRIVQMATNAWDVQQHRVNLDDTTLMVELDAVVSQTPWNPYYYLTAIAIPNYIKAVSKVAEHQTYIHQAALACSLERYQRARGQYPETCEELVPDYTRKLPHDLVTGEPMRYRRTDNGFLLYSIGADKKDDGGLPVPVQKKGKNSPESGDWVWRCPDLEGTVSNP